MDRRRPGETRQSPVTWPPRPHYRCKQREKDGGGCGTRTRKTEVAGFQVEQLCSYQTNKNKDGRRLRGRRGWTGEQAASCCHAHEVMRCKETRERAHPDRKVLCGPETDRNHISGSGVSQGADAACAWMSHRRTGPVQCGGRCLPSACAWRRPVASGPLLPYPPLDAGQTRPTSKRKVLEWESSESWKRWVWRWGRPTRKGSPTAPARSARARTASPSGWTRTRSTATSAASVAGSGSSSKSSRGSVRRKRRPEPASARRRNVRRCSRRTPTR
jgi:hypothetical protein